MFLLVKDAFVGVVFGAVNGSGYADGAAPPVYGRREFRGLRVAARHGWRRVRAVPRCAVLVCRGAVEGALSDVRAATDASFPGFVLVEVGVRVSDVTCCHPMSLAVSARRQVC